MKEQDISTDKYIVRGGMMQLGEHTVQHSNHNIETRGHHHASHQYLGFF